VAKLMAAGCPLHTLDLEITLLRKHAYFMDPQVWVWNKLDVLAGFASLRHVSLEIYICEVLPTEAETLAERLSEILRAAFGVLAKEPRIEFSFFVS
jgi:hypothetical protein